VRLLKVQIIHWHFKDMYRVQDYIFLGTLQTQAFSWSMFRKAYLILSSKDKIFLFEYTYDSYHI